LIRLFTAESLALQGGENVKKGFMAVMQRGQLPVIFLGNEKQNFHDGCQ